MMQVGDLPLYIDSTMLVCFRQCPRKFYYEYIQCLRPKGRKVDLVAGAAFAAGIEAASVAFHERGADEWSALCAGFRAFAEAWDGFQDDPNSTKSFSRTFQAVIDYLERYPLATDPVQPFKQPGHTGYEFSCALPLSNPKFPRHPSGEPFLYCVRFDTFGLLDSRLVIRDEKTTGQTPPQTWPAKYNLRNQFLGYVWVARQLGYDVDTVVVRLIAVLKTLFHEVEAIKIYSDAVLQRFEDQLVRDLYRLTDCYTSGYFDFDLGDSCFAFNRPCAFMDCCMEADPSIWYGLFDRERWDPINRTSTPIEPPQAAAASTSHPSGGPHSGSSAEVASLKEIGGSLSENGRAGEEPGRSVELETSALSQEAV